MAEADVLQLIREYLAALEAGATGAALSRFFTADVVQKELPNRLLPKGAERSLPDLLEAAERGRKAVSEQKFEILSAVVSGDRAAVEILWTGTIAVPLATLPAGSRMRAHLAAFFELRDGKIAAQRNYDCFEPW